MGLDSHNWKPLLDMKKNIWCQILVKYIVNQ